MGLVGPTSNQTCVFSLIAGQDYWDSRDEPVTLVA
jgi:hypothetical protein